MGKGMLKDGQEQGAGWGGWTGRRGVLRGRWQWGRGDGEGQRGGGKGKEVGRGRQGGGEEGAREGGLSQMDMMECLGGHGL